MFHAFAASSELKNKKLKIAASVIASVLILVSVVFAVFTLSEKKNLKQAKLAQLNLPESFTVTAHAGALNTEPNSMDSITKSLEFMGDGIIEVDVRFTPSGEPVLSHNEVKSEENEYVSLEEFFSVLKEYPAKVNLDLKEFSNLPLIQELAKNSGVMEQVFFTGVFEEEAQNVKASCPDIPYYLNVYPNPLRIKNDSYLDSIAEKIKNCGAIGINLNYRFVSEEMITKMHEKNLLVSLWTVDNEDDMYIALAEAPDNITTRNPDLLNDIIKKQSNK